MARLRIEMDRGAGWELRREGDADTTAEQVRDALAAYAVQFPHRALLNGKIVATALPPRHNGSNSQ
jgi:hypothetical protein